MRRCSHCVVAMGLVTCALVGCGSPPAPPEGPSVSRVDPTTVTGTVWGEVLDALTGAPLEGATVSLAAGETATTTTTDASGTFHFSGVPAGGNVGVTITKEGFTRATTQVYVSASAGNFPTEGAGAFAGSISLFPTDSALTVRVLGYDGQAIDGATVRVTINGAYVLGSNVRGRYSRSGVTAGGIATIPGILNLLAASDFNLTFDILAEPVDRDGDGLPEYLGQAVTYPAEALVAQGGTVVIRLDPFGGDQPLVVVGTNVNSLINGVPAPGDSVVPVNGEIRIVYNQPVEPQSVQAIAFLYDGRTPFPVSSRVENGYTVVISPAMPYDPGREYHLRVQASALASSQFNPVSRAYGAYFSEPASSEVRVSRAITIDSNANGVLDAGDRVELQLSQVVGRGLGDLLIRFPLYFNVDFDGSGTVGDARGELNSGLPIRAESNETIPAGPFGPSGFTRDYAFTMPAGSYSYAPNINLPYILDLGASMSPAYEPLLDPSGRPVATPSNPETLTVSFQ